MNATLLNKTQFHPSWNRILTEAVNKLQPEYVAYLLHEPDWLPKLPNLFNAFSLPLAQTKYILFGESPYPRVRSANGYAFWDGAVESLWCPNGLSKAVNRATSLRNFIKMLLVCEGALKAQDTSTAAISQLDRTAYIQTIAELFHNLMQHGILLLNASLVLSNTNKNQEAKAWQPFIASILSALSQSKITLILLGNIARTILQCPEAASFQIFRAEHPYNISFITNPDVLAFFKPFNLLTPCEEAQHA